MKREVWLAINGAAIRQRLHWLNDQPSGVLFFQPTGQHTVVVDKVQSQLRLWLADPALELVQSRLELSDPLYLVSPYSQAAMLALIWQARPKRVYVLGLGGGRIPLVLHHYLPKTRIECAEINPTIIHVAARFFGLEWEDRLQVAQQDGRDYLAGQPNRTRYDLILLDAFNGGGDGPYHLATREFYRLCRARLSRNGLLIANMLQHDTLFCDKVRTLSLVFETIYLWSSGEGNFLVIATRGPALSQAELSGRAAEIQNFFNFPFPFLQRAAELKPGLSLAQDLPCLDTARVLTDNGPVLP